MSNLSAPTAAALQDLHDACGRHLENMLARSGGWDSFLALESDVGDWLAALATFPESAQFRSAHRDLGLGLYALSAGLYRQAFSSLRSFVEVTFGAIHFSVNELNRRQWVAGRRDISWSQIVSDESGIYSATFVREFCPAALSERAAMQEELKSAYRRCSEYLHGNVETTELLPNGIAFVSALVDEWRTTAAAALRVYHHALFVRYYGDLAEPARSSIEPVLEQHLGTLRSVRLTLQLPIEETAVEH